MEIAQDRGDTMEKESNDNVKLREQMRALWQERVECTRKLLISIVTGPEGDVNSTIKRLRKNQDNIGDTLKPYLNKYIFCWDKIQDGDSAELTEFLFQSFGINWIKSAEVIVSSKENNDKTIVVKSHPNYVYITLNDERTKVTLVIDICDKPHEFYFSAKADNGLLNIYLDNTENRNMLTTLLKNNISMSKTFIKAKKAEDTSMDLDAQEALKDNATSTAAFLSGLNTNWSHKSLETLLLGYISLLKEETIDYIDVNHDAFLVAHEKIQNQANKIADALIDPCFIILQQEI